MNKRTKRLIAGLGVLLLFLVLAYPKIAPLFSSPAQGEQSNQSDPLQVEVAVAEPTTLQRKISSTGSILANETVDLRSEVSGKITSIFLKEGQSVQEGDLLIKINDSELQAQLDRAKHRLALAEQREGRQAKLLAEGGISQEDYDATLNEVNVLRSEVNLIEAQIDKTEIRAPFDGRVGLKYVSDGSYISPTTRIASLQNIDPVKIDFSIPERYYNQVQNGDKIVFDVQTAEQSFEGDIYAIEPAIERNTRSVQIRARSDNKEALLLPGSFADIELILESSDNALTVPTISLVPELGGQYIYLYRDGKVVKQEVKTGIRSESQVEIVEGLNPGDSVLTTGLLQVREGMAVEISGTDRGSS
ncbi:efflux RND transporter periplasmic adaptor subunit [Aliifodinibius salicampi]|uniref:Efflux RND transporter periplasmic adaptor subunit n=1 Tax=Fodinibius salicampi TaxID=1920655 RepID=A0ABT3Q1Y0_9BACT|nr:efflux RND transporter periplasmic adaptor subunit [Fodinibius salicampi]MCW9714110.1 efflux RND transporter periplasmic adaptor subunit [Fodinibius salicampi]